MNRFFSLGSIEQQLGDDTIEGVCMSNARGRDGDIWEVANFDLEGLLEGQRIVPGQAADNSIHDIADRPARLGEQWRRRFETTRRKIGFLEPN